MLILNHSTRGDWVFWRGGYIKAAMMHITKKRDDRWEYQKFFIHATHLGDIIVCTNMVYNLALLGKFKAVVKYSKKDVGKSLLRIFDYEDKIIMEDFHGRQGMPFNFSRFVHLKRGQMGYWCFENFGTMTAQSRKITEFKLPKCLLKPYKSDSAYQTCQFNSFSSLYFKKHYDRNEIDAAFSMFDKGNTYYLGRPGTRTYTAKAKTHFADLETQASFLLGCDSFFGVDSGMSHFAGALGVKGDVCLQPDDNNLIGCVETMYNLMYPTLRLHRRLSVRERIPHDKALL